MRRLLILTCLLTLALTAVYLVGCGTDPVTVEDSALVAAGPLLVPNGIGGYSGMNGSTCSACHNSNGDAPSMAISGPMTLAADATGDFSLTMTPTAPTDGEAGGLDVAADGGALLSVTGQGTKMVSGEIVHSSPRSAPGGAAITWNFQWQAPVTPGAYTIYAAALSSNGGGTGGDETGTTMFEVTVTGSNAPLVANAGPDQTVSDADDSGSESVTLDGSGSTSDGTISSWVWTENGTEIASGEMAIVDVAVGTHAITLTVTDDQSATATDEVVITVLPGGQSDGAALYASNCASCHGDATTPGPPPDALQKVGGARVCSIEGAIVGTSVFPGGVPEMQFLQDVLSDDDIAQISDYLNSFAVTGQQRYEAACAGCHGLDGSGGRTGEDVRGESLNETIEAIREEGDMRYLSCIPETDLAAIAEYLNGDGNDDGDDDCDDDGDHDGDDDGDDDDYDDDDDDCDHHGDHNDDCDDDDDDEDHHDDDDDDHHGDDDEDDDDDDDDDDDR